MFCKMHGFCCIVDDVRFLLYVIGSMLCVVCRLLYVVNCLSTVHSMMCNLYCVMYDGGV